MCIYSLNQLGKHKFGNVQQKYILCPLLNTYEIYMLHMNAHEYTNRRQNRFEIRIPKFTVIIFLNRIIQNEWNEWNRARICNVMKHLQVMLLNIVLVKDTL